MRKRINNDLNNCPSGLFFLSASESIRFNIYSLPSQNIGNAMDTWGSITIPMGPRPFFGPSSIHSGRRWMDLFQLFPRSACLIRGCNLSFDLRRPCISPVLLVHLSFLESFYGQQNYYYMRPLSILTLVRGVVYRRSDLYAVSFHHFIWLRSRDRVSSKIQFALWIFLEVPWLAHPFRGQSIVTLPVPITGKELTNRTMKKQLNPISWKNRTSIQIIKPVVSDWKVLF